MIIRAGASRTPRPVKHDGRGRGAKILMVATSMATLVDELAFVYKGGHSSGRCGSW